MAKTTCESLIAQDIVIACDEQVVKGMESDAVILNRDDIDFTKLTRDATNPNIITQLLAKTGKTGYKVRQEGNDPFSDTKMELVVGKYRNTWTNTVPVVVLANDPDVCANIIDNLANGKFVLVTRNAHKGPEGKGEYQIYGLDQGLRASAGENDKYSEDTEGGWLITLQETGAPRSATFLFDTDAATTAAKYASLLTGK